MQSVCTPARVFAYICVAYLYFVSPSFSDDWPILAKLDMNTTLLDIPKLYFLISTVNKNNMAGAQTY
jgi:hypothetical protein